MQNHGFLIFSINFLGNFQSKMKAINPVSSPPTIADAIRTGVYARTYFEP